MSTVVASLALVGALVTLFQLVTLPDVVSASIGLILLLVFGIIEAIAAVVWLLVDGGVLKTAPAVAGSSDSRQSGTGTPTTTTSTQAPSSAPTQAYSYGGATGTATGMAAGTSTAAGTCASTRPCRGGTARRSTSARVPA